MLKSKEIRKFSRQMKKKPTKSELAFRKYLVSLGVDIKQQMILGFYILDFVIPSKMLIIEIDGKSHNESVVYDFLRDEFCRKCGFVVLRIPNEAVAKTSLTAIFSFLPDKTEKEFRSALGKANAQRGNRITKLKKNGLWT